MQPLLLFCGAVALIIKGNMVHKNMYLCYKRVCGIIGMKKCANQCIGLQGKSYITSVCSRCTRGVYQLYKTPNVQKNEDDLQIHCVFSVLVTVQ